MTTGMAIEAGRVAGTPEIRGAAARDAARDGAISPRSDRQVGTPVTRYLFDEDGRILAEAIVEAAGG